MGKGSDNIIIIGLVLVGFVGALVADEMGYIGDDDDPPARNVKEALKRIDRDVDEIGEKLGEAIKARAIQNTHNFISE